jgi:hypothetical protein
LITFFKVASRSSMKLLRYNQKKNGNNNHSYFFCCCPCHMDAQNWFIRCSMWY